MRVLSISGAAFLIGATVLSAQAPVQPQPVPVDPKLEQVLQNWEKKMTGLSTLQAECIRITTDKAFNSSETYVGWAKYLKSNVPGQASMASLRMERKDRKDIFEQLLLTAANLYEYVPQQKVIRIHDLPQNKNGQLADDNVLGLIFGITAEAAKRRYNLKLDPPPPNDTWWTYLSIQPKQAADKADFSQARLVLSNTTYLPRQLWYVQPNGNEVRWEFPKMMDGAPIVPADFAAPALPPGWKFERMVRDPQPRVIRPNQ